MLCDTFGTSHFVLYREVVLSSDVEMYWYNRQVTSKCVLYRGVTFIQSVHYQRFYCMAVLRRCNTLQAQRTIEELFGRIKNIKEKAEHSEHMV